MLPRDRSERSLNAQTLFRKRNQLIEKACSNFRYLASCIHHLVFVAGLPLRKPRGIARNTSTRRGRRNSIPNPGVINDVSRSPGVGLLRREGFATHEIFLGQRPPAHLGAPRIPGPTTRGRGGGKRGKLVHDFLVSGGRLEFLAVVNTFYEILWKSS